MKLIFIIISFFPLFIYAQKKDSTKIVNPPVTTQGTVIISQKSIPYTTRTGYLQLIDEEKKVTANVFYTAYFKSDEKEISKRPITFCFNGGPGSSSLWLHIGMMGPKRIEMTDSGYATAPPYKMISNEYSWLDLTDMVFIDPVGTGFSHPINKDDASKFYGYKNDIKAAGEFIRQFCVKNNRWGSPKFIAGESYGTTRAAGLAHFLSEEYGMYLNGVILIAAALDFQTLRESYDNDLPHIANLPVFAASAFYHKRSNYDKSLTLQQFLKQAEDFAVNEYSVALLKGNTLSIDEKQRIAGRLSYFTSLPNEYILNNNLRIYSGRFRKELLISSGKVIGRFDSRMIIKDMDIENDYPAQDPSFVFIKGAFGTCINTYFINDLKFTEDLPYKIIGNVHPWLFESNKYLNVMNELANAMEINPFMKIWIANGYFDLATSYFGTQYSINHLNLPTELLNNISMTYYQAGHMMYLHKPSLIKIKTDAALYYKNTLQQ
ncbi:MAG: peptidase S10 [Bacteroidales bacterium]